ncbi:MAG: RNA polymerase sigma factor [Sediminispirochaetaceae bacterium]
MSGRKNPRGVSGSGPASDVEMVRRVCSGETELFRILIERHQRRILYLGRRFFSRPEDVEDYVQEVFLRAYTKLDSFSGAVDAGRSSLPGADEAEAPSFAAWLYKLAYRQAINARRAHLRLRESFFAEIETTARERPEDEAIRADTIDMVKAELDKLPGLYLLLIRLKYYEGFTFSRMSDITGIPEGTLKSHMHRCRKVLKKSLKRFGGSEE